MTDLFSQVAGAVVDRVLLSTRFSPPVTVPVTPSPAGASGGPAGGVLGKAKESAGQLLQPTARVYLNGQSDPIVIAPYGEADGSWVGIVVGASILISLFAAAFLAGRASK